LIDGLAVALVLHIYCGEHQTPSQRSGTSRLPDFPIFRYRIAATTGPGSTDVHTISHETTKQLTWCHIATANPPDDASGCKFIISIAPAHHHRSFKQWFRACILCAFLISMPCRTLRASRLRYRAPVHKFHQTHVLVFRKFTCQNHQPLRRRCRHTRARHCLTGYPALFSHSSSQNSYELPPHLQT
jgi:hypothetical protein